MNSKIRTAIIGCGRAAENIYLPILLRNDELYITAVIDPVKIRRDLIAGYFKGSISTDIVNENILQIIDAAIICTSPDTHTALADILLKYNKHVLVEKPLALSMEGLVELKETQLKSKGRLLMGFNHRYWRPAVELHNVLRTSNALFKTEIIFSGNYQSWNPVSFKSDALDDLGPHVFDLVSFIFSQEICSVNVRVRDNIFETDICTTGGIEVRAIISHSDRTQKTFRIMNPEADYYLSLGSERIVPPPGIRRKLLDINDMVLRKLSGRSSPVKKSYEDQLKKFIEIIRAGAEAAPDINDGIAAVKAAAAARLSIVRKNEVNLNEIT